MLPVPSRKETLRAALMKPRILVSRPPSAAAITELRRRFDVEENNSGNAWSAEELRCRAADKVGLVISGADKIDGALLDAAPHVKAVCNVCGRLQQH